MKESILSAGSIVKCWILTCLSDTEFVKFKTWHSYHTGTLSFYDEDNFIYYVNEETDEPVFRTEKFESVLRTNSQYTLLILDSELVRLQSGISLRFYKVLFIDQQLVRWTSEQSIQR